MFYDFLASRKHRGGDTQAGAWNTNRFFRKKFKIILESVKTLTNCLEIGPGEGIFAQQCKDAGLEYAAVERNKMLQNRLVEQGFNVQLGSAPPLPYSDECFDMVVAMAVLEHMPTYEVALKLLEESCRVLKPGGAIVVEVPDFLRAGIDFFGWDYSHSFILTPFRLEQILEDAGYKVTRTISFTGSLTSPLARFPLDIAGFIIHSRFIYWLAYQLKLQKLLQKYRKTFEPNLFVIAIKESELN